MHSQDLCTFLSEHRQWLIKGASKCRQLNIILKQPFLSSLFSLSLSPSFPSPTRLHPSLPSFLIPFLPPSFFPLSLH